MKTDPLSPFVVRVEPVTNAVTVTGPNAYRYVMRGAQSKEHAETWARRLNDVYAMGFRDGVVSPDRTKVDLFAFAERVARLNPDVGTIGPGMLAQLVAEARRLTE